MKQKKFGVKGPEVSVIGQGTWYLDHGDRKRAIAALQRGLDLGMTHIDTAEMYGDAELVIADAIAGRRRPTTGGVAGHDLGDEEDLVAPPSDGLAGHSLGVAVHLGGVDVGHAEV